MNKKCVDTVHHRKKQKSESTGSPGSKGDSSKAKYKDSVWEFIVNLTVSCPMDAILASCGVPGFA